MIVKKFIPREFAANNYLLYDENLKDAVLFDCAGSNDAIFKFIDENNLNLKYILITHAHFDHVGGLEGVVVHRCHGREGIGRRRAYHAAVKF